MWPPMESKVCKVCGQELPETDFRIGKGGARVSVCKACTNEKRAQARYEHSQGGGVSQLPFSPPTSTAKTPAKSSE